MLIIRKGGNVEFKKNLCRMSLRTKKGRVAVAILRVHTPKVQLSQPSVCCLS